MSFIKLKMLKHCFHSEKNKNCLNFSLRAGGSRNARIATAVGRYTAQLLSHLTQCVSFVSLLS